MTIDEAIERLLCAKEGFPAENTEPYYQAMELGIEALKLTTKLRTWGSVIAQKPLPGETEK